MPAEIDKLQLVYGNDFAASSHIKMKHPKVGDIVSSGEKRYFSLVTTLTAIPSDMKAPLDDIGIDYSRLPDFDLFCMLIRNVDANESNLFLHDIDLSKFVRINSPNGAPLLAIPNTSVIINDYIYRGIVRFLCAVFKIKKVPEIAGNDYTRRMLIDCDREDREYAKEKRFKSSLLPMISSMVNCDGFKYNYQEVLQMPFAQFMDSVARTQTIKMADQLSYGFYSGSFDTKKFDTKKLDWMKDLDK